MFVLFSLSLLGNSWGQLWLISVNQASWWHQFGSICVFGLGCVASLKGRIVDEPMTSGQRYFGENVWGISTIRVTTSYPPPPNSKNCSTKFLRPFDKILRQNVGVIRHNFHSVSTKCFNKIFRHNLGFGFIGFCRLKSIMLKQSWLCSPFYRRTCTTARKTFCRNAAGQMLKGCVFSQLLSKRLYILSKAVGDLTRWTRRRFGKTVRSHTHTPNLKFQTPRNSQIELAHRPLPVWPFPPFIGLL